MLHSSASLSMLFSEYGFLACFEKAAQRDFHNAEFMFPYNYDIEELKQVLAGNKLEHTLHNLPADDWVADEQGIARISDYEEEFRDGVVAATHYVRALGNRKTSCPVNKIPTGFSNEQIHTMLMENLHYTANMLMKEDILLLIEPVNHFNIPGSHLTGTQQALKLIDGIGCCNSKIQYDIYHTQQMEDELTNTMTQWADKIGHLQVAGNLHRGEPGTGEINYEHFFTVIESSNHDGRVGCEYKPQTTTEVGLRWMGPYR